MPPQALVPFGTKAFVFHENPDENADAVDVFREIARITGGVYLPFDRNSAAELAGLLAAIGAYAAGGVKALEKQRRGRGAAASPTSEVSYRPTAGRRSEALANMEELPMHTASNGKAPQAAPTACEAINKARFAVGSLIAAFTRVEMALPVGKRGRPYKSVRAAHGLLHDALLPLRLAGHALTVAVERLEAEQLELQPRLPLGTSEIRQPTQQPLATNDKGAAKHRQA